MLVTKSATFSCGWVTDYEYMHQMRRTLLTLLLPSTSLLNTVVQVTTYCFLLIILILKLFKKKSVWLYNKQSIREHNFSVETKLT